MFTAVLLALIGGLRAWVEDGRRLIKHFKFRFTTEQNIEDFSRR